MNGAWTFEDTNNFEGFNNAAEDHFKGQRTVSLVRESLQNAIDARISIDKPVRVDFTLETLSSEDSSAIFDLAPIMKQALSEAEALVADRNSDVIDFFQNAVRKLEQDESVTVFGIHDSSTTGLTGPTNRAYDDHGSGSKWFACVKSQGLTVGKGPDSGGAFGHGKNAALSFGMLSTIFYATQISVQDNESSDLKTEVRLQGKTSLVSRSTNKSEPVKEYYSREGYFGLNDSRQSPLINSQVPNWSLKFRKENNLGDGTSIFIPFPILEDHSKYNKQLWNEIKLAVLANFYLAIKNEILVVGLNNMEILNHENLREIFDDFYSNIASNFEEPETVRELLISSLTLHSATPELSGEEVSPHFGKFTWAIRISDATDEFTLEKTIGFARTTRMLITRDPQPNLVRFGSSVRPFDMFVAVIDPQGSSILKRLENPAHNKFEFDRITDTAERKILEKKFKNFTDQIRDIIAAKAEIKPGNEVEDPSLSEFFEGDKNNEFKNGDSEYSNAMKVGTKRIPKPKLETIQPVETDTEDGDGSGVAGGSGAIDTPGGTNPGNTPTSNQKVPTSKRANLNECRALRIPGTNQAKISIAPQSPGNFKLKILKAGDTVTETLEFKDSSGVLVSEISLGNLVAGEKSVHLIELSTSDFRYAIQPILEEV